MLKGPITAKYADYVPEFPDRHHTNAQRAGLKFERDVLRRLGILHTKVEPTPWLYYQTPKTSGICQPDGLVWLTDNLICIVECKLTWVRSAREKLLKFYGPIIQAIYPEQELCYLQIYKNHKHGAHKRTLSLYELDKLKEGQYKECQARI